MQWIETYCWVLGPVYSMGQYTDKGRIHIQDIYSKQFVAHSATFDCWKNHQFFQSISFICSYFKNSRAGPIVEALIKAFLLCSVVVFSKKVLQFLPQQYQGRGSWWKRNRSTVFVQIAEGKEVKLGSRSFQLMWLIALRALWVCFDCHTGFIRFGMTHKISSSDPSNHSTDPKLCLCLNVFLFGGYFYSGEKRMEGHGWNQMLTFLVPDEPNKDN